MRACNLSPPSMLEEVNDASDCNSRNSFFGSGAGRLCQYRFVRQFHAPKHDAQFDHDASACIGTGTRLNTCADATTEVITN